MTETSFASLSPTLLARKGGAKPAMRPQIAPLHGESANGGAALAANLEDLGWNDMGDPHVEPDQNAGGFAGLTPEPVNQHVSSVTETGSEEDPANAPPASPAKQQIEDLAARIASNDSEDMAPATAANAPVVSAPKPRRSALSRGKRAAFTLRLDSDRHLKLRLASTVRGRSAQALMTEALDRLLGDMPEIDKMAAQAASK